MSTRENRIKKLLYQSWYRGCKETDKIVGGYAKKHIESFSDKELDELEQILEQNDNDIYDWLSNKKPTPEFINKNSVFEKLRGYIPANEV